MIDLDIDFVLKKAPTGNMLNRCGSGAAGVGIGVEAHATEVTGTVDYLLDMVVNLILYTASFLAESLTVSTIT